MGEADRRAAAALPEVQRASLGRPGGQAEAGTAGKGEAVTGWNWIELLVGVAVIFSLLEIASLLRDIRECSIILSKATEPPEVACLCRRCLYVWTAPWRPPKCPACKAEDWDSGPMAGGFNPSRLGELRQEKAR